MKRPGLSARQRRSLGLDSEVTRRDFVNGALAGAGAILTGGFTRANAADARVSAAAKAQSAGPARGQSNLELGADWTGPGGLGDYRQANGNTHEVVNAAHAVRDGRFDQPPPNVSVEDTTYDLVIVGGGITGLICAWEHARRFGAAKRCLLLDNHRMFGGEARGNVFEVDGHRLEAPQGSNAFTVPHAGLPKEYWDALKIPVDFRFTELSGTQNPPRVARDHYGPMQYLVETTSLGYWFRNAQTRGRGEWHKDIWNNDLRDAPLPPQLKRDLVRWYRTEEIKLAPGMKPLPPAAEILAWRAATEQGGVAPWLDSMSYADYLQNVLQLDAGVSRHVDPLIAVGLSGTASDVVSAYAAQRTLMPGVTPHSVSRLYESSGIMTAPSGNAFIARYLVKALLPDALPGGLGFHDVVRNPVDPAALDRPGAATRIRLASTAVRVEHEGSPDSASHVRVTYTRAGATRAVRARQVIMAGGGWMNRHVARDLPGNIRDAYATFCNGPVLTANLALRQWRFLERMGISGARWFDGLGFFGNIIQPMKLGERDAPFHPDQPIALTLYIPFLTPGLPAEAQCAAGRAQLLGPAFADFELKVRQQMQELFGEHGFNARRDLAGLILNRWGHAYICPKPGFFFGRDGKPAPRDVVRAGYGRVQFAHAELQGNQSWYSSALEARRASEHVAAHS